MEEHGVMGMCLLALSAFFASAAATLPLQEDILSALLMSIEDWFKQDQGNLE